MKFFCISLLSEFIKWPEMNPVVGRYWPTGRIFHTPGLDQMDEWMDALFFFRTLLTVYSLCFAGRSSNAPEHLNAAQEKTNRVLSQGMQVGQKKKQGNTSNEQ